MYTMAQIYDSFSSFFLIKRPTIISSYFFLLFIFRSDVEFSIDDFNTIGGKVPLIANVKPHGKV